MASNPLYTGEDKNDTPLGLRRRAPLYTGDNKTVLSGTPDDWWTQTAASQTKNLESNVPAMVGLGRKLFGDDEGAAQDFARYNVMAEQARKMGPAIQSFDDAEAAGGGVGDYLSSLAYQGVGMIPDVAATATGIGIGGVAAKSTAMGLARAGAKREAAEYAGMQTLQELPKEAVEKLGAEAVEKQARDKLAKEYADSAATKALLDNKKLITAGRAVGATLGGFPSINRGSVEALEQTDAEGAAKIATANLFGSAIDSVPVFRFLDKLKLPGKALPDVASGVKAAIKKDAERFLPGLAKEFAAQGLQEGGTEVLQTAAQLAGHNWANGNVDIFGEDSMRQYVQSFFAGAALGGAMGAGAHTVSHADVPVNYARDKIKDGLVKFSNMRRAAAEKNRAANPEGYTSSGTDVAYADLASRAASKVDASDRTARKGDTIILGMTPESFREDREAESSADMAKEFFDSRPPVVKYTADDNANEMLSYMPADKIAFLIAQDAANGTKGLRDAANLIKKYVTNPDKLTADDMDVMEFIGLEPKARAALDAAAGHWGYYNERTTTVAANADLADSETAMASAFEEAYKAQQNEATTEIPEDGIDPNEEFNGFQPIVPNEVKAYDTPMDEVASIDANRVSDAKNRAAMGLSRNELNQIAKQEAAAREAAKTTMLTNRKGQPSTFVESEGKESEFAKRDAKPGYAMMKDRTADGKRQLVDFGTLAQAAQGRNPGIGMKEALMQAAVDLAVSGIEIDTDSIVGGDVTKMKKGEGEGERMFTITAEDVDSFKNLYAKASAKAKLNRGLKEIGAGPWAKDGAPLTPEANKKIKAHTSKVSDKVKAATKDTRYHNPAPVVVQYAYDEAAEMAAADPEAFESAGAVEAQVIKLLTSKGTRDRYDRQLQEAKSAGHNVGREFMFEMEQDDQLQQEQDDDFRESQGMTDGPVAGPAPHVMKPGKQPGDLRIYGNTSISDEAQEVEGEYRTLAQLKEISSRAGVPLKDIVSVRAAKKTVGKPDDVVLLYIDTVQGGNAKQVMGPFRIAGYHRALDKDGDPKYSVGTPIPADIVLAPLPQDRRTEFGRKVGKMAIERMGLSEKRSIALIKKLNGNYRTAHRYFYRARDTTEFDSLRAKDVAHDNEGKLGGAETDNASTREKIKKRFEDKSNPKQMRDAARKLKEKNEELDKLNATRDPELPPLFAKGSYAVGEIKEVQPARLTTNKTALTPREARIQRVAQRRAQRQARTEVSVMQSADEAKAKAAAIPGPSDAYRARAAAILSRRAAKKEARAQRAARAAAKAGYGKDGAFPKREQKQTPRERATARIEARKVAVPSTVITTSQKTPATQPAVAAAFALRETQRGLARALDKDTLLSTAPAGRYTSKNLTDLPDVSTKRIAPEVPARLPSRTDIDEQEKAEAAAKVAAKPAVKPAIKPVVAPATPATATATATGNLSDRIRAAMPGLQTDAAKGAAETLIAGKLTLENGKTVPTPQATMQRGADMAESIAKGWATYPVDGTYAEQMGWFSAKKTKDVPQPSALGDILTEATKAAEAIDKYGLPNTLSAKEANSEVFAPAVLPDWTLGRSVVDDVSDMEQLCLGTSNHTVRMLLAHGYAAARAFGGVRVPGSDSDRLMDHYVAVVDIDGIRFVVDQPQSELFTPVDNKSNNVKIKTRKFAPRFIPEKELASAYNTPGVKFSVAANDRVERLPFDDFKTDKPAAATPVAAKPAAPKASTKAPFAETDYGRRLAIMVKNGKKTQADFDAARTSYDGSVVKHDDVTEGQDSARHPSKHDHAKETSYVGELIKKLGFPYDIKVMSHTDAAAAGIKVKPLAGGIDFNPDGSITIILGDDLHGAERIDVLHHEVGHYLLAAAVAKKTGKPVHAASFDLLKAGNLFDAIRVVDKDLADAMESDFNKWKAGHLKNNSRSNTVRASRAGIGRAGRFSAGNSKPINEMSEDLRNYVLDPEEWIADNIARALNTNAEAKTLTEKFFADIAAMFKKLWDAVIAIGKEGDYKPAPSVEAFVKQLFDKNVSDVKKATGMTLPRRSAEQLVTATVLTAAGDTVATPNSNDRTPKQKARDALEPFMEFVRVNLTAETRAMLDRVLSREAFLQKMNDMLRTDADPNVEELIILAEDAEVGLEAKIAIAYRMFAGGQLTPAPNAANVFKGWREIMADIAGVATEGDYAQRVFTDWKSGYIEQQKAKGKTYNPRAAETSRRTGSDRTRDEMFNKVGDIYDKVIEPWHSFIQSNMERMRASGIPALRMIGARLHRPGGTTGEDPGMLRTRDHTTSMMLQRAAHIIGKLTPEQTVELNEMMQKQTPDAVVAQSSPEIRTAHAAMRAYMKRVAKYADANGVKMGHQDNFWPVVMDIRDDAAADKLRTLLKQKKFAAAIRDLYKKLDRTRDNKHSNLESMIDDLVNGARRDPGTATTFDASPEARGTNLRSMQFIYDLGDTADIDTFASLQSDNMNEIIGSYIEPLVKKAEFTKRFGVDGKLLEKMYKDAVAQGATPEQMAHAKASVAAALGTYGAEGSPVLGMISPALSKKFSGRKAQAVVQGLQAYNNVRLLPLSLLSSLVDPMGIAVRAGGDFGVLWDGVRQGFAAMFPNTKFGAAARDEIESMLAMMEASSDMASEASLQFGFGGKDHQWSREVNNVLFGINGLSAYTKGTRYMALHSAHAFLAKHAARANDPSDREAQATSTRYLHELGLRVADVTGYAHTSLNGKTSARAKLLSAMERETASPAELARDDRVRSAVMQFVDDSILRPNSQQTPLWHSDPYMGLVAQYKSFAYAIHEQIGKRIWREMDHGNFKVIGAALAYLPIVLMAELLREFIQWGFDGNPRRKEWGAEEYTWLAAERTGLSGPGYGVYDAVTDDMDMGRLPGSSQTGPTGGQIGDIIRGQSASDTLVEALPLNPLYRHHFDKPEVVDQM